MAMTRQEFNQLVARLEEFSRAKPQSYKTRLALLAALGYTYVVTICLVLAGLWIAILVVMARHPNYLAIKLLLVVGGLSYVVLRSMWVSLGRPQGIALTRRAVPELFGLIDEIATRLRCQKFHEVLLVDDFNASVWQVPRLGLLGWYRNYLVLGLPLMQALTPDQFKAVMAHEFAHLSGEHGRFGGWIYRVRKTWYGLMERLDADRRFGSFLFTGFFGWYAPFFNAYSFVFARANEYEADRCAAELVGVEATGTALIQVCLKGRLLEEKVMPEIYRSASLRDKPPDYLETAVKCLRGSIPNEWATRWRRQALLTPTGTGDTHPSLADRLKGIGFNAEKYPNAEEGTVGALNETAADRFLGKLAEGYRLELAEAWIKNIAPMWEARFEQAKEAQKKLEELDTRATQHPLPVDEQLTRARQTLEFKGDAAARPLFEEILAREPQHAEAAQALGEILIKENDPRGAALLEAAMDRSHHAVLPGCQLLQEFHRANGRPEEAQRFADRADEFFEIYMKAEAERSDVTERDTFLPHELDAATIEGIRGIVAAQADIGSAVLARKQLEHFPEEPFYVLGVKVKVPFYKPRSSNADHAIVNQLVEGLRLPGAFIVVVLNSNTAGIASRLHKVAGVEIYNRTGD